MKVKSESHEKVKIHIFPPFGMKICVDEFFCDWLTSSQFLDHLDALLFFMALRYYLHARSPIIMPPNDLKTI